MGLFNFGAKKHIADLKELLRENEKQQAECKEKLDKYESEINALQTESEKTTDVKKLEEMSSKIERLLGQMERMSGIYNELLTTNLDLETQLALAEGNLKIDSKW